MTSRRLETALPFWADRSVPPELAGPFAQALEASGVVDYFWVWDQLTSWWPRALWREEHTPLAATMADCDSFHDAFVVAGVAAAATTRLGVQIGGTDAIRNGPAELLQTMLTLAALTDGRAMCAVAAGELKQIKPFGRKRSEGLARMEDILRIVELLQDCEGPIDFEGNHWTLLQAYIGCVRPYRPQFWCLGGGPRLIDMAARYADGFISALPAVFPSPERYAEAVTGVRDSVASYDRDPDAFGFGLQVAAIVHEDQDVIDGVFDNVLVKFFASIAGRFTQADWLDEGLEPVWPPDWHYALRHLPAQMSVDEAEAVAARVPRAMVERSVLFGTAEHVAEQIGAYVDAGANFIEIADLAPSVLGASEAQSSMERSIEICRLLKARPPGATGAGA